MSEKKTLRDLAGEAREQGVGEVGAEVVGDKDVILIDVREPEERARGYIPGSVGVARGVLERDIEKKVFGGTAGDDDMKRKIVCYCGGGSRSLLAAQSLRAMGFDGAVSLVGGFGGWVKGGGEVESGDG